MGFFRKAGRTKAQIDHKFNAFTEPTKRQLKKAQKKTRPVAKQLGREAKDLRTEFSEAENFFGKPPKPKTKFKNSVDDPFTSNLSF